MVVDFPFEDVLLAANCAAETTLVDVLLDVGFELWSLGAGAAYRTEDVVILLYLHFTRESVCCRTALLPLRKIAYWNNCVALCTNLCKVMTTY